MVEWKKLGDVSHYYRGVTYNKKQEVSLHSGGTKIFRANNINIGINTLNYDDVKEISKDVKVKDYQWLYKDDILICAGSGSKEHVGKVAYISEDLDYAYGGFMGKIVTDNSLVSRYLFHVISSLLFKKYLEVALNSTTINNLNSEIVNNFEVPIPSLSEQNRIVGILDTFTSSIENLKQQIAERRKQYEHYRDQLLDLEGKEGVEMKTIQDVCVKICSGGTPSTSHKDYYNGNIPWLRTQEIDWKDILDTEIKITQEAIANSSAKIIPANCVIVAMYGATAAKVAINKIPLSTNQACCNLEIDESISNYRYVYHWLCKEYINLKSMGEGSQNNINGQKVKGYSIPIPSLLEQSRIVSILDTFEASILNLEAQLSQREKQYEYYRNKLLTFE